MPHLEQIAVGPDASVAVAMRADPLRIDPTLAGRDNDRDLLAVMAARFPVVRRLVGEDSFDLMARRFIRRRPCRSPGRRDDGEAFAGFIRSQGAAASFAYVADIAALEDVYNRARDCVEARPLGARAFASLPAQRLNAVRVQLHPSFGLVTSRFPIVTIWQSNRRGDRRGAIERWRPEDALVVRRSRSVEVWRLPAGGHAFLRALAHGQSVAAAACEAMAESAQFDFAANRALLAKSNAIVGFCENR